MSDPFDCWQQLATIARAGGLPPDVAAFIVNPDDAYVGSAGAVTMDKAMGLGAGGALLPWSAKEMRDRRNSALKTLYVQFYPGSARDAAKQILRLAARRRMATSTPVGRHEELIDIALKMPGKFPKERQLHDIVCSQETPIMQ